VAIGEADVLKRDERRRPLGAQRRGQLERQAQTAVVLDGGLAALVAAGLTLGADQEELGAARRSPVGEPVRVGLVARTLEVELLGKQLARAKADARDRRAQARAGPLELAAKPGHAALLVEALALEGGEFGRRQAKPVAGHVQQLGTDRVQGFLGRLELALQVPGVVPQQLDGAVELALELHAQGVVLSRGQAQLAHEPGLVFHRVRARGNGRVEASLRDAKDLGVGRQPGLGVVGKGRRLKPGLVGLLHEEKEGRESESVQERWPGPVPGRAKHRPG